MIEKDKVIYLAVPYAPTRAHIAKVVDDWDCSPTDARDGIMHSRACEADKAAAWLMLQGYTVLSPISHSHGIAQHMAPEKRVDHELWMRQDAPFVEVSDRMLILTLDGWRESKGISHEISEFFHKHPFDESNPTEPWWLRYLNRTPNGPEPYEISERPA